MAFWILEERGHGKFKHLVPKRISAKKAESLGDDSVFNGREEAQRKSKQMREN